MAAPPGLNCVAPSLPPRVGEPAEQPIERPAVHDPIRSNSRESRVRDRGFGVSELIGRVCIAIECKETPGRAAHGLASIA